MSATLNAYVLDGDGNPNAIALNANAGDSITSHLYGGHDSFSGGANTFLVYGGDGGDLIQGGSGGGRAYGDAGNDNLNVSVNTVGATTLYGGLGDDILLTDHGTTAAVTLYGGDGIDYFGDTAPTGAVTFNGGAGVDYVAGPGGYATSGCVISLATGLGSGGAAGNTYAGIEGLGGSIFGDALTGNGQDNIFTGNNGGDSLYGGGGNDLLVGNHNSNFWATFTGTRQPPGFPPDPTAFSYTDSIVFGASTSRTDDFSADSLFGGDGDDVLLGGGGADHLDGDLGIDTASYLDAPVGVTASLLASKGTRGDAQGDTLTGIETLIGSR